MAAPIAAADDLQAAASEACECLEVPYSKFEELMKAFNNARTTGDYSKMQSMEADMQSVAGETEQCFEGLKKKYPMIAKDKSLQDQVGEIAEKKCPNPVKDMFKR